MSIVERKNGKQILDSATEVQTARDIIWLTFQCVYSFGPLETTRTR